MTPYQRVARVRPWGPKIETATKADSRIARANTPDELITLFSTEIWRFVSSQISRREDAEDVVMEVFSAAVRDFGQLHRADNQRHWLFGIARRKIADAYRRQYRRAQQPISAQQVANDEWPSPLQMATRDALSTLPQEQREVLILKYVHGLSMDEVGKVIRRSIPATNSLLQRGRQSLRDAMGTTFESALGFATGDNS